MTTRRTKVSLVRVPPHSIEAEQAVLGGLMLVPAALEIVGDVLVADDFFDKIHQMIYRAIVDLSAKGVSHDAVTLGDWFHSQGRAESTGGASYIIELANSTPSAANIGAYAAIVRDKALLRRLIDASSEIAGEAFEPSSKSARDVIDIAEQKIFRIAEFGSRGRGGPIVVREGIREVVESIYHRHKHPDKPIGLSTGFTDLDKILTGLQPSDLVIIAARPAMGKTAIALNIAEHAAVAHGTTTVVFSMEMSSAQLSLRLLAARGRINQQHLMSGELAEEEWPRLTNAISVLHQAPLYIDDTPALSPLELRNRARRLRREHDLGLIVVDYLQLMQTPSTRENRNAEISEISRNLKALAKELNVPVIALSQLNRALEHREDKRPMMADLRESGAIEQDADVILFIYRDEYYNRESTERGVAEVIIGKHRKGPTGTVKLLFRGECARFNNLAPDAAYAPKW